MAASWQDRGGVIYGLFDPRTGEMRYVGKTQQDVGARMRSHLHKARRSPSDHRDWWIRNVLDEGFHPEIDVLETLRTAAELIDAERWSIQYYRSIGCRLTNKTDGGEGASGYRHSPEVLAKVIAKNREAGARKRGIPRQVNRKFTNEEERAVVSMYAEGASLSEVSSRVGKMTAGGIRKVLKRHGVALRPAGPDARWASERRRAAQC